MVHIYIVLSVSLLEPAFYLRTYLLWLIASPPSMGAVYYGEFLINENGTVALQWILYNNSANLNESWLLLGIYLFRFRRFYEDSWLSTRWLVGLQYALQNTNRMDVSVQATSYMHKNIGIFSSDMMLFHGGHYPVNIRLLYSQCYCVTSY